MTGNKDLQTEFALRHTSVRWGAVIPKSKRIPPPPLKNPVSPHAQLI